MSEGLTDVIRIDDRRIDARDVIQRVAENLFIHGFDESVEFPEFDVVPAQYEAGARFPVTLYYDLEQAALGYGRTWVQLRSIESRFPLLARLKRAFHRLAVYYVNRYGERQMMVNGALLRVLNTLVKTLDGSESEIVALRHELADLRARLEHLEMAQGGASRGVREE